MCIFLNSKTKHAEVCSIGKLKRKEIQCNLNLTNLYIMKSSVLQTIIIILQPDQSYSKMYGTEPRKNEQISPVPWHFVKSRFHCTLLLISIDLHTQCLYGIVCYDQNKNIKTTISEHLEFKFFTTVCLDVGVF